MLCCAGMRTLASGTTFASKKTRKLLLGVENSTIRSLIQGLSLWAFLKSAMRRANWIVLTISRGFSSCSIRACSALAPRRSRGLGRVSFPSGAVERVSFECDQVDAWLAFDAFDEESWENAEVVRLDDVASRGLLVTLDLSVKGALSIRQYTTEAFGPEASPDYRQLALASSGEPLIPGTTWAGAFRSAYRRVSPCSESDLFGSIEDGVSLSRIVFSESIVKGGEWKQITRNSIDRYTGGVIDGALFTELTHFGGSTTLELYVDKPRTEWIAPLVALVADLHNGFLPVGGLTAVGHGLFSINSAKMLVGGVDVRSFSDAFCHPDDLVCPNVSAIVDEAETLLVVGSE